MNKSALLALTVLALVSTSTLVAQTAPAAAAPKVNSSGGNSPHETTSAVIGGRGGPRVIITYGRPYTIKPGTTVVRKIWGGQVPWDKADRMGSDEATVLLTPLPLVIGETTLPAGAYALYIIPSESGVSKLGFSTNFAKWGVPVDEKSDVARFDLKKETLAHSVDQLTIAVANDAATPNGGVIKITWENTQFSLPFALKK